MRRTLPSLRETHTDVSVAARPAGVPPMEIDAVTAFVPASIRVTVSAPVSEVHTEPAANTIRSGVGPTRTMAVVWSVDGSNRVTRAPSGVRIQAAPPPTATSTGV